MLKGGPLLTSGSITSTQQRGSANVITVVIYVDSEPGESPETSATLKKKKKKMNFKDLGVPQGSILDPLSFHLDLFCFGNVIRTCDISGFFLGNDDW